MGSKDRPSRQSWGVGGRRVSIFSQNTAHAAATRILQDGTPARKYNIDTRYIYKTTVQWLAMVSQRVFWRELTRYDPLPPPPPDLYSGPRLTVSLSSRGWTRLPSPLADLLQMVAYSRLITLREVFPSEAPTDRRTFVTCLLRTKRSGWRQTNSTVAILGSTSALPPPCPYCGID